MPTPRIRRTPEQAKSTILETAAQRLASHGMKGLNIKDIAEAAGINHGTVLHHFGSADRMRAALLSLMTERLVEEMAIILNTNTAPETVFVELFRLMSQSGHIKLLAWRAMEGIEDKPEATPQENQMFQEITQSVLDRLGKDDLELAQNMILLAFSSAIGWGICGSSFQQITGLNQTQREQFPAWVGSQLPILMSERD